MNGCLLLYCVCLDHVFDLALDSLQVEASRVLHGWIVNRCLRQLTDFLLNNIHRGHHKTARYAGIEPGFRLYDFRHTFGSRSAMAGVDLATLKELMGHSSITTTMRYVDPMPEHKRGALDKLEQFSAEHLFAQMESGESRQKSLQ